MSKVSVVIPVYNAELYLKRCLDSVINQSLKDIEIICINDGSTDNSLNILKEYSKTDSRIILTSISNKGSGSARNIGIKIAQGKFLGFVDADDCISPIMYETLYTAAKTYDVDCVHCNYDIIYPAIDKVQKSNLTEAMNTRMGKNILYYDMPYYVQDIRANLITLFAGPVWNKIYKTSAIKNNNVLFPDCKMQEDACFNIFAHFNMERFAITDDYLYSYYINQNSVSTGVSDNHFEVFKAFDTLKEFLVKNDLKNRYNNYYEDYVYLMFLLHAPHIEETKRELFLNMFEPYISSEKFKNLKTNYSK